MSKFGQKTVNFKARENKYIIGMNERANIIAFLKHLNEKNYAEAHKYLKKVMESKIKGKISSQKDTKVF